MNAVVQPINTLATPEPLSALDLIDMLVAEPDHIERSRIAILLRMRVAIDEYAAVLNAVGRLS